MAGRGKFIEIHIAVARCFELHLGPAELIVLHLQLDLMDLQLMHQLLHVLDRHGRDVALGRPEPRFRLPKEFYWYHGFTFLLGSAIAGTRFANLPCAPRSAARCLHGRRTGYAHPVLAACRGSRAPRSRPRRRPGCSARSKRGPRTEPIEDWSTSGERRWRRRAESLEIGESTRTRGLAPLTTSAQQCPCAATNQRCGFRRSRLPRFSQPVVHFSSLNGG